MNPRVRNYIRVALAAWALLCAFLLFWEFRAHTGDMEFLARSEARASWQKDILYRIWANTLGPLYVMSTGATPPNRCLVGLPDLRRARGERAG